MNWIYICLIRKNLLNLPKNKYLPNLPSKNKQKTLPNSQVPGIFTILPSGIFANRFYDICNLFSNDPNVHQLLRITSLHMFLNKS